MTLSRLWLTDASTCGELYLDDARECYTLEPPNKNGLPGSCIPQGRYRLTVYPSPKFGRLMPLLLGVPHRSSIEMHWGNTAENTDGCILLGRTHDQDFIGESREAFDAFWGKVQGPIERLEAWITVIGGALAIPMDIRDVTVD